MKSPGFKIGFVFFILWLLLPENKLLAQTKVQVVTKTVEQQFVYKAGEKIEIEGEKANIQVKGWNQKEVKVILKLISKAPSQETARQELDYQRYILEKKKETLHIKNYFVLPKGKKDIQALLLAEYEIWLPQEATVSIANLYGSIQMESLQGKLTFSSRYGNILLSAIQGKVHIKSYFGDFTAKNISGHIQGSLDHTKTSMDGISGDITLTNNLGDIILSSLNGVKSLRIDAAKSDISLMVKETRQYQYRFTSEFGEITIPDHINTSLVQHTSSMASWQSAQAGLPLVQVKTTFGTITLQGQ
ncbi:DUF4097 domain-containing protein [Rhodocytophaga rosea]|uniref:DUF4097 domain-containing protein n=1 Tax=Rhodocytophaga rosea TaxID=2704465 RepID=A0A6C0GS07_9BACT|nr:DUF4097 family beta strand repeat-containing protein [Rhodocytophaga rosea]QHT70270.1 DUF4097 domain-containing protein [Rhodocytophaga rosea]